MFIYLIFLAFTILAVFLVRKYNHEPQIFLKGKSVLQTVQLTKVTQISPDSKIFTFKFGSQNQSLGLPIGQHIIFKADLPNKEGIIKKVSRKYTPTSPVDTKGEFQTLIKIYFAGVHQQYIQGGKMTQYINSLKVGDHIQISGPKGKLSYVGNGRIQLFSKGEIKQRKVNKIGFIAGGTGIAPCFQIIQAVIDNKENIQLSLLFANKTEEDILLRDKLEQYQALGKLNLFYTLDSPREGWKGFEGFVSEEMVLSTMPPPSDDMFITFCGPRAMNQLIRGYLLKLGYTIDQAFKF